MHKYNAHGATDVTGFGLLGHAQNLAKSQKNQVSFIIHNLPVISQVNAISQAVGESMERKLKSGKMPETSGQLVILY